MRLSIVIPAYNEITTIEELLIKVQQVDLGNIDKEIIIVDDYSRDGTREILQSMRDAQENKNNQIQVESNGLLNISNLKIIFQEVNTGKGGALRAGISNATGDIVIIQDADLEYNPHEYLKLITPIIENKADVVYGSRFMGKQNLDNLYLWNYIANKVLTYLSNIFSGLKLTDMETCYKVFKRDIIQEIKIEENRFGFEPEITAKIAKLNVKLVEVPISYNARKFEEGKKIGWRDGFKALYSIGKYNLFRRKSKSNSTR